MKDEMIEVKINDQIQELTLDEISGVAGRAGKYYYKVMCKAGCGFMKDFDNSDDACDFINETASCSNCGDTKNGFMLLCCS